ncbi:hypothetical protein FE257_005311 [Aspergillus nanangensis]|uniref:Endonuclease/exonuclease/phosphatase domain-containing protein n=1 Tax=Aspergillus nanangensis TaxID=2582783 RepID=A0AAD4GNX8_ASPNN|nr:hypothetical protein FE257_005311 [Aspergillus nanangensis]
MISQLPLSLSQSPKNLDRVNLQPFYEYLHPAWKPIQPRHHRDNNNNNNNNNNDNITNLRITTWNIDFQTPAKTPRTAAALNYLSQTIPTAPPSILLLQEMIASDLDLIKQTPWIQTNFNITDLSPTDWQGTYGTTMLIDKRLPVQRVFRVPYSATRMQRDALFVDIAISATEPSSSPGNTNPTANAPILRVGTTHLESLLSNPPIRPVQLRLAAGFMHGGGRADERDEVVLPVPHAAILAGDLNAFAPEDLTAPGECGLRDAFLVLGGQDGEEESFTWGQQVPVWMKEQFGCSRMDKVLFCGGLEVKTLRRIGEGETVWIDYPREASDLGDDDDESSRGERVWVTDHLGLEADFEVIS